MANRVVLDAQGLRVSKPGVNVLTAAPSQLLFNSAWSQLGEVDSGTIAVNWSDFYSPRDFPLFKTFPTPPLMAMWATWSDGLEEVSSLDSDFGWGRTGSGGAYHNVEVQVTTTVIRVWSRKDLTIPGLTLTYRVMDYNL